MGERPVILTASNRKGGCAKTSSVFHLGAAFALRGLRVLWIDLDPQGSLTQIVYPREQFDQLADEFAVTALFAGLPTPRNQLIDPTKIDGDLVHLRDRISLVPASPGLRRWNHPYSPEFELMGECIEHFVTDASLGDNFDIVLIDTPPNLELLTWAAMVPSRGVYTPAIPEDFAAEGIWYVEEFVRDIQRRANPALNWLGVVKTMTQPRLVVHSCYTGDLEKTYGEKLFAASLPLHTAFKDAVWAKTPLPLHKPKSAGSKAVMALAEELADKAKFTLPPIVTKGRGRKAA